MTTRSVEQAAAREMRTRASVRTATSPISSTPAQDAVMGVFPAQRRRPTLPPLSHWTTQTLIDPGSLRRLLSGSARQDAIEPTASPLVNFWPNPELRQRDAAAVHKFVRKRESVIRCVHDAIAAAVDRQKQYADVRGRKHFETFVVRDRVLLSTAGIQPSLVTNLGTNKLMPRYMGPFKVSEVLSDVYTLQLPTALRLPPPSTWDACFGTILPLSPATLVPRASVPALHAATQFRILLLQFVHATMKATQKLRARSLLFTGAVRGSSATAWTSIHKVREAALTIQDESPQIWAASALTESRS
ncbi:hypothetical protein F443_04095 [Phytophthora nicotianae P1569]|uniref:Uncharacterized protein n=1 Tax=Phytophthora nicotianae P1569 TaxID=1317065 RepID=V9FN56_PHYNI|nr:hypothetical protein F443_04095 [Phytophthora nicotianae P1569]